MSSTLRRLFTPALVLVGTLVASPLLATPSADAKAAPTHGRVVHIAASKAGTPYRYGASGPSAFDCSGFTSDRKPGDLVFFHGGGGVYHVAIYAGGNSVWHAPRPGETVHREHLWTNAVSYGRVG